MLELLEQRQSFIDNKIQVDNEQITQYYRDFRRLNYYLSYV